MVFKSTQSPFVARSAYRRRSNRTGFGSPMINSSISGSSNARNKSNIRVCVRVRPSSEFELSHNGGKSTVRVMDERVLVFDPEESQSLSFFKGRPMRDPTARRNRDLTFAFDHVFGPEATSEDVFNNTTKLIIDSLMEGINCSVFAYGATGAGKTFTMLGTADNKGVIARTMNELFERIDSVKDDMVCNVEISYLEIYNETVRDLLSSPDSPSLVVREDRDNGVGVAGLSFHKPCNIHQLFDMLDYGNQNRTQHPTDANKESSRSHAVFHLYLHQQPRTADISTDVMISKMALIDLAGSERAAATANCGERFREGANINRSLLALGNCINALAEGKRGAHIPYRDSKLTRILKDSLGGNCKTVMIANVSPSVLSYEDTYNTLKYADRAKQIKADLKQNIFRVDRHIHQYGKIVQELHQEIHELKEKLADKEQQLEFARREGRTRAQRQISENAFAGLEPMFSEMNKVLDKFIDAQENSLSADCHRQLLKTQIDIAKRFEFYLKFAHSKYGGLNDKMSQFGKRLHQRESRIARLDKALTDASTILSSIKPQVESVVSKNVENLSNVTDGSVPAETIRFLLDSVNNRSELCQLAANDRHQKNVIALLMNNLEQYDRLMREMCNSVDSCVDRNSYASSSQCPFPTIETITDQIFSDDVINGLVEDSNDENVATAGFTEEKLDQTPRILSSCSPVSASLSTTKFDISPSIKTTSASPSKTPVRLHVPERLLKQNASGDNVSPTEATVKRSTRLSPAANLQLLSPTVSSAQASTSNEAGPSAQIPRYASHTLSSSKLLVSKSPTFSITPSGKNRQSSLSTDDEGFKKPLLPIPRVNFKKRLNVSPNSRKTIDEAKRVGVPSLTENFFLGAKSSSGTESGTQRLSKSPSAVALHTKRVNANPNANGLSFPKMKRQSTSLSRLTHWR